MSDVMDAVADVLTRSGYAHGAVFYYVNGEDDDWASFYSDWLLNHWPLHRMVLIEGGWPPSSTVFLA